jgi:hypothetical protein
MTPGRNLTFEKRMKSLDERLLALEATPRVREAMTAAGLAPPVPPTKPSLLKSASSLWPTAIRKPRNRTHKSGECHEHHSARRPGPLASATAVSGPEQPYCTLRWFDP